MPGPSGRNPGLKDVAERAGVSVKTASNVVRGYVHVADSTRARVQQAIDELGYTPNISARSLRSSRSGVIALALPELDIPYFAELSRCIIRAASRQGWTVLIDQTDGLPLREQQVMDGIRAHLIDGLIFSPLSFGAEELEARPVRTPMVLLGERIYESPFDHVVIDNEAAAREATEHLLSTGRRRIAAIGRVPTVTSGTSVLRERGHRTALEAAGVPVDERLIGEVNAPYRSEGAAAMERLLDQPEPPDAVFCFNDLLAVGALRTLQDHGLRVPEDVAVVGFDDSEEVRYSHPRLTSISPDKDAIADLAVDLLAARLSAPDDTAPPQQILAPFHLEIRASSASRS